MKLSYRPDIDGLRGVAILAVVIYHAFPRALPGGFCGVDIFFVISGYLISLIIFRGLEDGTFSFCSFYARRIRRLFPALLVLLPLTLLAGYVMLLPTEFEDLGRTTAAGTLFIQNIVFSKNTGYFAPDSHLVPLLHLWSLAVEEQFYIFVPPLLVMMWRRRQALPAVIVAFALGSLAWSIHAAATNQPGSFYFTHLRAWEFLAGVWLAWTHVSGQADDRTPRLALWMSVAGLGLLALSFSFLDERSPYPGWKAAAPVLGAVLLIAAGPANILSRQVLCHPAMVWIGLISYPLYLFHWPVFSFAHIVKGPALSTRFSLAAIALSFAAAAATYYFVERKWRRAPSRWTVPFLVAAFATTGAVGLAVWQGWIPARTYGAGVAQVASAIREGRARQKEPGLRMEGRCLAAGRGPTTLFLGDSFSNQYKPRIARVLAGAAGSMRGALLLAEGGIPPIPGVSDLQGKNGSKLTAAMFRLLDEKPRIDRVVISACWPYYFDSHQKYFLEGIPLAESRGRDLALRKFRELLRLVRARSKQVAVVLDPPWDYHLAPERFLKRSFLGIELGEPPLFSYQRFLARGTCPNGKLRETIAEICRSESIEVIDPADDLVANGECIAADESGPIRSDMSHLRASYVREKVLYLDHLLLP